jgi:NAD(P)-dependent dehydrogenase (short-subunit alcohol dehydrogenase family)
MSLMGRAAIVTGASEGLGLATASLLVRRGASVLITGRRAGPLEEALSTLAALAGAGQRVVAVSADVSSPDDCGKTLTEAREAFGGLDILVNNAGVYGPMGPLETVAWDEWEHAVRVNLLGTVLMCRAAIPLLRERGRGKIVNLSGGGATAPLPFISAYAASKAAVVRLTETLAEELRSAHIDVNAVAPGALNTRLLDEVLSAGPERVGKGFYERAVKQQQDGGIPLDRGAELVAFLASAESDGITGRLLSAVWDDWAGLPEKRADLDKSDVYTLRRIVPEDRGLWK